MSFAFLGPTGLSDSESFLVLTYVLTFKNLPKSNQILWILANEIQKGGNLSTVERQEKSRLFMYSDCRMKGLESIVSFFPSLIYANPNA
jgi:hypothetical protein